MKRLALILILALLCLQGISAETVLLCMSDSSPEIEREDWPQSVMRAFEDGTLDVFFESGHIVTNAFFDESAGESDPLMPPAVSITIADRIHKLSSLHGADIVIFLKICFPEYSEENLPMPEKVEYTVYRSGNDPDGPYDYFLDAPDFKTEAAGLDFCVDAGNQLAQEVSSMLHGF